MQPVRFIVAFALACCCLFVAVTSQEAPPQEQSGQQPHNTANATSSSAGNDQISLPAMGNITIDWTSLLRLSNVQDGVSANCSQSLKEVANGTYPNADQILLSSGKTLGDTGLWLRCHNIGEDTAHYCMAAIHGCPSVAASCFVGLCVPATCSGDDVSAMVRNAGRLASAALGMAEDKRLLRIDTDCRPPMQGDTGTTISFIITGLLVILVAIGTLAPSLGHFSMVFRRYFKTNRSYSPVRVEEDTSVVEMIDMQKQSQSGGGEVEESSMEGQAVKEQLPVDEDQTNGTANEVGLSVIEEESEEVALEMVEEVELDESNVENRKERTWDEPWLAHILKGFSVQHNISRLLAPIPGDMACLNGLRVMSMMWIILGHTFFFALGVPTVNIVYAMEEVINRFSFQIVMAGVFGVDSFFFLSGLLIAYHLYQAVRDGKMRGMAWFVMFYVHRFARIVPLYAFCIMIYLYVAPVLASGPMWRWFQQGTISQRPYCWANLLFINNFMPIDQQCFGWGWFLAVDWQFSMVSPFAIALVYWKPVAGILVLLALLCGNLATASTLTYTRGFSPNLLNAFDSNNYFTEFYMRPYCRASPYLIGMLLGLVLVWNEDKRKGKGPLFDSARSFALIAACLAVLAGIVFSTFWDDDWNTWENSVYLGFSRALWASALAGIVCVFQLGKGGWLLRLFSWNYWDPLAKLTFGAYLLHPIVILLYYYAQPRFLFYTDLDLVYWYLGHLILAYACSALVYVLVEKPAMNLEGYLLSRFIKKM